MPSRPWDTAAERLAKIAVLAAAYFLAAYLGYMSYLETQRIVAVWPAVGVAVAGLLLFGRRSWPGLAIGGLLARLLFEPSLGEAIGMTVASVAAPMVAECLLERYGFDTAMARLRDVLAFIVLGGLVSSLAGATIATAVLVTLGDGARRSPIGTGLAWWITDFMGIVIVAPLLLVLGTAVRRRVNPFQKRGVEVVALIVATATAGHLLFTSTLPVAFLVFPFVLWAGLRLGVPSAATVNVLLMLVAGWASVESQAPFSQLEPVQNLTVLHTFNAGIGITSLVLAAVTAERKQAAEEAWASRVRLVEAADAEPRRVERNLHDGAQQRLVSMSMSLSLVQTRLAPSATPELQAALRHASDELRLALAEFRQLARGLHPAILDKGLAAAVESVSEQAQLPVTVSVPPKRFAAVVEMTAYFVVCEALANIAKHARASAATVTVQQTKGRLVVEVSDDGLGGADPGRGSGLTGLVDRVATLGSRLRIDSPIGRGARVRAELPCG